MGYSPSVFWNLSIGEIHDLIESFQRKETWRREEKEAELKDLIQILFIHSRQTGNVIANLLDSRNELKGLDKYYPDFFSKEEDPEVAKKQADAEILLNKARMEDYAFHHNFSRKRGENHECSHSGEIGSSAGSIPQEI